MRVINAIDVNDAYFQGLQLILAEGKPQESRAGKVLALEEPLTIAYKRPLQRVLFDPVRDANPFFHIFESLWLLAGRDDARWLDRFVSDFSSRFSEVGGTLHGSYGFRWRKHFDLDGEGNPNMPDQLSTAIRLLRENPENRRVVIQMWDPVADLGADKRDVPCNLMAVPRIVNGALDLTVFNRSNDFVLGLTGANAVQFSVLLEYLAGRIGVAVGKYHQISTNAHVYVEHVKKLGTPTTPITYPKPHPMGTSWDNWDKDLRAFMFWADNEGKPPKYFNSWFALTAEPFWISHRLWRFGKKQEGYNLLMDTNCNVSPDWRAAAIAWMERRLDRMAKKQETGQ